MMMRVRIGLVAAIIAAVGLFVGCADEAENQQGRVVNQIVDSLAAALAGSVKPAFGPQEVASVEPVSDPEMIPVAEAGALEVLAQMRDMVVVGKKAYVVFGGGLVIYDFETEAHERIDHPEVLNVVALQGGEVYVGGEHVYRLQELSLVPVEVDPEGMVTALYGWEYRLMIGTECGLYEWSELGLKRLAEDVTVRAMSSDGTGLWVGTDGDGLYRWDGREFRQRYLRRDPHLWDTVTALAYNYGHLYVGSSAGLHIYDGGRWQTVDTSAGLPSLAVNSIDASEWVVYIGTDRGVFSYFDGELMPIERLAEVKANVVCRRGAALLVATDGEGLWLHTRMRTRTIVEPVSEICRELITLAF
jgi:ligand-binding sensor domain-containing protein